MKKLSKILMAVIIPAAVLVSTLAYEQYLSSQKSIVVLATTTSTYDSGLLDYLMPKFENKTGVEVHVISVGTGQAIETAKRGDADLVLVHSKKLELEFVNSTYGIHRVGVMYNDFILIGPTTDPAEINVALPSAPLSAILLKASVAFDRLFIRAGSFVGPIIMKSLYITPTL